MSIYWFFIPLFSMYMLIPFISLVPKDLRRNAFIYIISLMLIFNAMLPLLFNIYDLSYNNALNVPFSTLCIYIFIGYYIDNYQIKKKYRYGIYLLALWGLLIHITGTWFSSINAGEIVHTYKGYTNLPCILYSSGIFLLFKTLDAKRCMKILNKIFCPFYGTTLGIYLMHWYLLDQVLKNIKILTPFSYTYRILGAISVFVAAAFLSRFVQKIPVLNKIVPR